MRYFISAGEASGDAHASMLIRRLKDADPAAEFIFLGGDRMAAEAGSKPLVHIRDMAFMGFSEVLRHLPDVSRNLAVARRAVDTLAPDAVILVDYPSFNFKIAERAAQRDIPVYYFIPPKVWAWKSWRVKAMKRFCRKVFCIFPFEVDFYRKHAMEVSYVGNPSVEETRASLAAMPPREEFLYQADLTSRPILALVPGSRLSEIRNNLPVMNSVALSHRELQPVIAGAPGISPEVYRQYSAIQVVDGVTLPLMAYAEAALVTSGTATLECALAGTPQIALYRANGSRLSYSLMKRILKVNHVTLPNLIADATVIPEMLLHECRADLVDSRLREILPGGARRGAQLEGYEAIARTLGNADAAGATAGMIVADLKTFKK